ncbi:hypothetical protein LCGC14_1844800, partial [marine sediment metagenome]
MDNSAMRDRDELNRVRPAQGTLVGEVIYHCINSSIVIPNAWAK